MPMKPVGSEHLVPMTDLSFAVLVMTELAG